MSELVGGDGLVYRELAHVASDVAVFDDALRNRSRLCLNWRLDRVANALRAYGWSVIADLFVDGKAPCAANLPVLARLEIVWSDRLLPAVL